MSEPDIETLNAQHSSVILMKARARVQGFEYRCFLDEHADATVPTAYLRDLDGAALDGDLVVNASFRYQTGSEYPEDVQHLARLARGFFRHHPLAWVADAGTCLWMPYWARGEWAELLAQLQPGAPAPAGMSASVRRALWLAGILVPPGYEQQQRERWAQVCREAEAAFRASECAIVRRLIPPLHLRALQAYYRALREAGRLKLGDKHVPDRYVLYGEIVGTFIHVQLKHLIGQIVGESLKPSYVYFASYEPGASLPPHVDREEGQYAVSLLVDYVPERDGPCGWPLFIQLGEAGTVAADLAIGDFVLYKGQKQVHSREPLPAGHRSTSIFFFYVPDSFDGRLW